MDWIWPLDAPPLLPDNPGRFAAVRRHDVHTGLDLYCEVGTKVLAVEDGTVVEIEEFTGPTAESPWWHETWAVLVQGASGVVVYGEVAPAVEVGDFVPKGAEIGLVMAVLKKFKGRPMVMLHLELMVPGARETVWWKPGEPQPVCLLDPTPKLPEAPTFDLARYDEVSFRAGENDGC